MKKLTSDTTLTIKHYKEPLLPIPKNKGYGYYGALLITLDGDKVQCHICGETYRQLSLHIYQTHKMKVAEYREKFQLSYTTALVSETLRQEMKERTLAYLRTLTKAQIAAFRAKALANQRHNPKRFKIRLETKNRRGTCPDQLLYKIREVTEKIGHTPSLAEFIHETDGQRYKHLIFTTFGSWLRALKLAKLTPKERSEGLKKRYSNEELLEHLALYAQEHGKLPTATDSKRGFIPNYEIYLRRFGSFDKARREAGVYDII